MQEFIYKNIGAIIFGLTITFALVLLYVVATTNTDAWDKDLDEYDND